ncbi:MAG: S8 family serine peptidase [Kiritimatiellales bacterium]|nr:S8 family serine peptidase [Kiritimatiellales bacterium]
MKKTVQGTLSLFFLLTVAVSAQNMAEAAGTTFFNAAGDEVAAAPAEGLKAFYFSLQNGAACRRFAPTLVDFYTHLKKTDPGFEIFLVSTDKGRTKMMQHMQALDMPWLAVLGGSKEMRDLMAIKRNVLNNTTVPTLVVMKDGQVMTTDGRKDVQNLGTKAYKKWVTMAPEQGAAPPSGKKTNSRAITQPRQRKSVAIDPSAAPKVDPVVLARFGRNQPIAVTILCKTQLLDMPGGFAQFCKRNADRKRSELRSKVVEKLKEITQNGEQKAVLKAIDGAGADPLWIINALTVELAPETIQAVAALDEVKYIYAGFPRLADAKGERLSEVIRPPERDAFSSKGRTIPWNLEAIGADRVWKKKQVTGENVVVAMLEAGIDYTHQDLRNNLWVNAREIPNNGRDDDENGFVDDFYGFNFRTGSCEVRATTPKQHHGTMTSGIVAGDGTGGTITGVAPRARLMLLSGHGAYAYQYALEQGADIMSMSFSIPDLGNGRGLWRLMSEHAICAGLVLVSGCGNFQKSAEIPVQIRIPEGIPCVIGAGGLDKSLQVPPFCSLGPVEWASVKFYADYPLPSGLIKPDVCGFPGPGYPLLAPGNGEYIENRQGNSFSSPHIAGVAALMLSAAPELPAWRIREIMEVTARDVGDKGKDTRTGAGLVDAWEAVSAAESAAGK